MTLLNLLLGIWAVAATITAFEYRWAYLRRDRAIWDEMMAGLIEASRKPPTCEDQTKGDTITPATETPSNGGDWRTANDFIYLAGAAGADRLSPVTRN